MQLHRPKWEPPSPRCECERLQWREVRWCPGDRDGEGTGEGMGHSGRRTGTEPSGGRTPMLCCSLWRVAMFWKQSWCLGPNLVLGAGVRGRGQGQSLTLLAEGTEATSSMARSSG